MTRGINVNWSGPEFCSLAEQSYQITILSDFHGQLANLANAFWNLQRLGSVKWSILGQLERKQIFTNIYTNIYTYFSLPLFRFLKVYYFWKVRRRFSLLVTLEFLFKWIHWRRPLSNSKRPPCWIPWDWDQKWKWNISDQRWSLRLYIILDEVLSLAILSGTTLWVSLIYA